MKDYRVTVKVRNNRILKAIEAAGGDPGGKWCEANGLPYQAINNMINMTRGPLSANGSLSQVAQDLCDVLNKLPEDLWSNDQLYPLERHMSDVEMDRREIQAFLPQEHEQSYLPDFSDLERKEVKAIVDKTLATLQPRTAAVLRMRYEDDATYIEIAKNFGITQERVRQIEVKALRILRNPALRELRDCLDDSQRKALGFDKDAA